MSGAASAPDRDLAKILKVLVGLDSIEVEALIRFYVHGQDAARVKEDLGISTTRFLELKSRVRCSYLALATPN